MVNWNVEPLPDSLVTHIRPPIISARRLLMARPKPGAAVLARGGSVDLAERLEQPRPCDRRECRCRCPAPANVTSCRPSPFGAPLHSEHDFALLGELDGVAQQVDQDLPQPGDIAHDPGGHVRGHRVGQFQPFLGPAHRDHVHGRLRRRRADRTARLSKSRWPASIFEKSRMSLMTPRALPLPPIESHYRLRPRIRRGTWRSPTC